jgi:hypothetical protein
MIKSLKKMCINETYLNKIKSTWDEAIANIALNGENLKLFPLKLGMRQRCPLSSLLLKIVLVRIIWQEKEVKMD